MDDCTDFIFHFRAVNFRPFWLHNNCFCDSWSQFFAFLTALISFFTFMQSIWGLSDCMDFNFAFRAVNSWHFWLHGFHFFLSCSQFLTFLTAWFSFFPFVQSIPDIFDYMDFIFPFVQSIPYGFSPINLDSSSINGSTNPDFSNKSPNFSYQ